MPALIAALAAAALAASAADAPARERAIRTKRWAVYYGAELSRRAQASVDLLVVDRHNLAAPLSTGPVRLAYLSAGEADDRRPEWKSFQGKPWIVEPNPEWPGAQRVDVRAPEWTKWISSAAAAHVAAGYDGVMLDTLDVADYLESTAPARFKGAREAAAALVGEVRRRSPKAVIVVNNGLWMLDKISNEIDAVLVEDVYTSCGAKDRHCVAADESETREKEAVLDRFRASTGKPVLILLYARPSERGARWLAKAAARARKRGYLLYLASPELDRWGRVDPFGTR